MHTDYALRMLVLLGTRTDRLVTVDETAKTFGASKDHMVKVAQRLTQAGYVESVRGNSGGLRLARKPKDINILQVVQATESDYALVGCFSPRDEPCIIHSACLLRLALNKALMAFFAVLEAYTLQDLLVTRPLLEELFSLAEPKRLPRKRAARRASAEPV